MFDSSSQIRWGAWRGIKKANNTHPFQRGDMLCRTVQSWPTERTELSVVSGTGTLASPLGRVSFAMLPWGSTRQLTLRIPALSKVRANKQTLGTKRPLMPSSAAPLLLKVRKAAHTAILLMIFGLGLAMFS